MLTDNVAVDLDETSFNLDNVEMMDDDVDVHNSLICEDRVGIDVNVEPNVPYEIDEEKKKEFEKTKDEILAGVPEEVKARFGEIYFSTFGKFVGPVLVLDPYRVNPGELRNHWMVMCQNVSINLHLPKSSICCMFTIQHTACLRVTIGTSMDNVYWLVAMTIFVPKYEVHDVGYYSE